MRNQKAHTRAKRSSLRLFSFVRGASGIRQRVWVNIQASYPEGKDDHPKGNNIVQNTSMQALDQARSACMQGLLKSKILNALDCFPKAARAVCAF